MKKRILVMLAFVLAMCAPVCMFVMADNDRVITFDRLPAQAQALLKRHFADKVVMIVTVDFDDYTVMYQSGEKVEFNKSGDWKEFECKTSAVPPALIPEQIKAHVKATFPGVTILKLDRDRRGYEVKLNNGLELEYNRRFQVIDIDD